MATLEATQLRALVAAVHRPGDRRRVIAVRAEAVWDGVDVIDGEPPLQVVACPSPLAVRAAVADFVGNGNDGASVLAVLTPCSERDLGPDLLARCIKGRVLSIDPFSAVMALLRATTIDPLLVRERWLIDDLVAIAPTGGWPDERPVNGVLGLDLAWSVWQLPSSSKMDRGPPESSRQPSLLQHPNHSTKTRRAAQSPSNHQAVPVREQLLSVPKERDHGQPLPREAGLQACREVFQEPSLPPPSLSRRHDSVPFGRLH